MNGEMFETHGSEPPKKKKKKKRRKRLGERGEALLTAIYLGFKTRKIY
jgi:hypothetical protein